MTACLYYFYHPLSVCLGDFNIVAALISNFNNISVCKWSKPYQLQCVPARAVAILITHLSFLNDGFSEILRAIRRSSCFQSVWKVDDMIFFSRTKWKVEILRKISWISLGLLVWFLQWITSLWEKSFSAGALREQLLPGMSSYNCNGVGEKEIFSFISPLEIGNYKIHIFLSLLILVLLLSRQ